MRIEEIFFENWVLVTDFIVLVHLYYFVPGGHKNPIPFFGLQ